MTDSIPNEVLIRFRDKGARPKVVRVYKAEEGWTASPIREVITGHVAEELKMLGFTSVEIKWHRTTKQLSLI